MGRLKTLFTGQWGDMPLEELAEKAANWGYDGLELACWGDHFEVSRALDEPEYCQKKLDLLEKHGLDCQAISSHLVGQMVLDRNDERTDGWVPEDCRGDSEKKNAWAIEEMKRTAQAAKKLGVPVVNGFTGSSIWPLLYSFPPVTPEMIDAGFALFAERWNPILDVFGECEVRFALEVHPTEIAFDIPTARRALAAIEHREEFGFNFDPSHLHWQGIDPVRFIREFPDRIYHVHIKDAAITLDGASGILSSHLDFGDPRRGWDFRSPGHGGVDFEAIIRALNDIGYEGPLSVEWEDCGMDREYGAADAAEFVARIDFPSSGRKFDDAFNES
ncbi:Inosose dehydratase [Planctomycetes bacterium Pan216]|uniref:Inosose dehydratase n=1 Tax=Kolteria novifilia TaxID=2527975 RepID=A0A518B923_9BACT|nr:Inosose dehydratase [Planctomycetes bacterium Pan216]